MGPYRKLFSSREQAHAYVSAETDEWARKVESGEQNLLADSVGLLHEVKGPQEVNITEISPEELTYARNVRMRKSKEETVHCSVGEAITLRNVCVLQYLVDFGSALANKIKNKAGQTRGWKRGYPRNVLSMAKWFKMDNPSEGVSAEMVLCFCKAFKFNLYAYDGWNCKVIEYRVKDEVEDPEKKRSNERNTETLMFWIKDELFPILDKGVRASLTHQTDGKLGATRQKAEGEVIGIDTEEEEFRHLICSKVKGIVIITEDTNMEDYYKIMLDETGVHPLVEIIGDGIRTIRNEFVIVKFCEQVAEATQAAKLMNIPYTGQSLTSLGMKFMKNVLGTIEESQYTDHLRSIVGGGHFLRSQVNIAPQRICECSVPGCFMMGVSWSEGHHPTERLLLPSGKQHEGELDPLLMTTVDINNNYPSNMFHMQSGFPIFSTGDDIEEWHISEEEMGFTKKLADDEPSFFFCVTSAGSEDNNRVKPFWHGNGFYDIEVVKVARKYKYPFKITHRLRAKNKALPKDFFQPFLTKLQEIFPAEDAELKKLYKIIAVCTIGCLGTKRNFHDTATCTTYDREMMSYLYWSALRLYQEKKKYGNVLVTHNEHAGGYTIHARLETQRTTDNRPINAKIVQYTYVRLYDMWRKVQEWDSLTELIQIRTDAMTFLFPDIETKRQADRMLATETDWKIQDFKALKSPRMRNSRDLLSIRNAEKQRITVYDNGDCTPEFILSHQSGAFIDGKPGVGKTAVIKRLVKHLEENGDPYVVCAFLNRVADRLDGKTIHMSLGRRGFGQVKYVIVDEAAMLNADLWRYLLDYKRKDPDTVFYLFGDYRQCKPVEEGNYDYENSKIIDELLGQQPVWITIQKNYRYGPETEHMLDRFWEKPSSLTHDFHFENNLTSRTLVCTHTDRKRVNLLRMQRLEERQVEKNVAGEWLFRKPGSWYKLQDLYLTVGLPVVSFEKHPHYGIDNRNATYKVLSWNRMGAWKGIRVPRAKRPIKRGKRKSPMPDTAVALVGWDYETDQLDFTTIVDIPLPEFQQLFCPAYALTANILQGCTITGSYPILNPKKFEKHQLYTALSRCKDKDDINIIDWPEVAVDEQALVARLKRNVGNLYGSTWKEFIDQAELPKGCTWEGYGLDFEIDHKKPIEAFRKEGVCDRALLGTRKADEEAYNHYSNLQALKIEARRTSVVSIKHTLMYLIYYTINATCYCLSLNPGKIVVGFERWRLVSRKDTLLRDDDGSAGGHLLRNDDDGRDDHTLNATCYATWFAARLQQPFESFEDVTQVSE
ncbi:hypothetical protein DFS34DRAFT_605588 [Phlyctochytrium arcticum]|nr:hypothetical protein DFS34DRAFT_605588 [Phlyctochytrium arcticum]